MAEALSIQLIRSQRYQLLPVSLAIPAQATAVAYGRFSVEGSTVRVDVAVQDLTTNRRTATVSATDQSMLPPLTALARRIDPDVQPQKLPPEAALHSYAQALESPDARIAASLIEQTIQSDPGFGRAYIAAIEIAKLQGDRSAIERYLGAAEGHAQDMEAGERAVLARERAAVRGDVPGQIQALTDLARSQPGQASHWRTLGQAETAAGRYDDAATHFRRAIELDPADVQSMNEVGYALAYVGRLDEASEVLRRYERARPADGNPLDSLGDVHFYSKRYREAAQFYQEAQKREPEFQNGAAEMKAAIAWHVAGEATQAEQAFARFRERRSRSPEMPVWAAQWLAMTGRTPAALELLTGAAPADRAQAVVLALEAGQRDRALRSTQGAPPVIAVLATPDWERRIATLPEPAKSGLSGYALMFSGRLSDAAAAFGQAAKGSTASDQAAYGVLQAWCLRQQGTSPDPAVWRFAPIPQAHQINPLAPVYFRRLAELQRAAK